MSNIREEGKNREWASRAQKMNEKTPKQELLEYPGYLISRFIRESFLCPYEGNEFVKMKQGAAVMVAGFDDEELMQAINDVRQYAAGKFKRNDEGREKEEKAITAYDVLQSYAYERGLIPENPVKDSSHYRPVKPTLESITLVNTADSVTHQD